MAQPRDATSHILLICSGQLIQKGSAIMSIGITHRYISPQIALTSLRIRCRHRAEFIETDLLRGRPPYYLDHIAWAHPFRECPPDIRGPQFPVSFRGSHRLIKRQIPGGPV
jgi:hypothetical protein